MRTLTLVITTLALGSGCARVGLSDSVDLEFNWAALVVPADELHLPYAAGTSFQMYPNHVDDEDTVGWTIESSDPSVLRVDSTINGDADVTAVGAGTTTVSIRDADGALVHETEVDVRQPTRAELFAHGPLIIGRDELQQDWSEIRVIAGGSATFEVHWYDGETRLYGNGTLSAVASGDIVVEPRQSFLFEDREWITFTPGTPGTYDVELFANGISVQTVRIVAVTEAEISEVLLHGMDESAAQEGELLTVYAQAYDASGTALFGMEYAWDLDGELQEGFGDLFRYNFVPGTYAMLGAHSSSIDVAVMIQAEEGWVDSTNDIGCSVTAAGVPPGFALAPLALGVALIALGRRRR